jgi:ketosteroid isomerase-like protein
MDHRLHHRLRPLAPPGIVPGRHVDALQIGYEGFNRGDLTQAREIVTDDVEWRTTGSFPGLEGAYRGPDALDEWMESLRAEWREFDVSLVELLAEREDAIAVAERLWGLGRESGVEVEMRVYAIYRFNAEGKLVRREAFTTAEEALNTL